MANIGKPDRWWYEASDNPLEVPVPEMEPAPAVEPAAPTPIPAPVAAPSWV